MLVRIENLDQSAGKSGSRSRFDGVRDGMPRTEEVGYVHDDAVRKGRERRHSVFFFIRRQEFQRHPLKPSAARARGFRTFDKPEKLFGAVKQHGSR